MLCKFFKFLPCLLLMGIFSLQVQAQGYNLNGDAVSLGNDCYRLTNNVLWQQGTVWYTDQLDLRQPFDIEFELYFGNDDAGADGIMFVLQTVGNTALGYNGGGMGFGGFNPALGVEFDTFRNQPYGDPVDDHLAIQRNGNLDHNSNDNLAGPFPIPINIENGQNHHARVVWDPVNQNIDLYFKCIYVTQLNFNLIDSLFNGNPIVYWGFTSATGGLSNEHRVCVERNVLSVQNRFDICTGDTAQLQAFGAGIGGTYSWTPNYFIDNVNTQSPLVYPPVDTTYIVTYTDVCGGTEQDTVEVFLHDQPVFSLGPDTTFCPNEPITLRPDSLHANTTYLWSDASTDDSLEVIASGLYWMEQDIFGCSFRDSIIAITIPMPPLDLGPDVSKCPEDAINLDVTQPASTYLWDDGSTAGTRTLTNPGTYWVALSANGCTLYDTLTVTDYISPTVNLPANVDLCAGSSVLLDPGQPGFTYNWSTNASTPTLSVTTPGQFWVNFEDGNGCDGSDTVQVTEVPLPTVTLPTDTAACDGESIFLNPNNPALAYQWSDGSTQNTLSVNTYGTVSVTFTDANNCENTASVDIVIHPLPTVNLPEDTLLCEGIPLVLDPGQPGYSYNWSTGDTDPTLTVFGPGTYTVDFVDANDCQNSDQTEVTLVPQLSVNLGPDREVCGGEVISLDADPDQRGITYLWSTGAVTRQLEIEATGEYWVEVSNECFTAGDTLNIEIQTESGLFVPTAFTPNGDGLNDEFLISALNVPDFQLIIFNRWGQQVFSSDSPLKSWDGTLKGQSAPEGVYPFIIKFTNCKLEPDVRQGSVTLIR